MTGAGAASLAFVQETSFETLPGTPSYYAFGRNPTVTDLTLENALQRLREADAVEAVESVKQNFEGAIAVEAVVSSDVHSQVEGIVFNDSGTGFVAGRPPSATIYAGIDYLDGTAERALSGAIPIEYAVNYEQGAMTTYTLTMAYADESENTSLTPTSVTQASDGSSVPWHGTNLTINATSISKLQSATMTIANISRFQRGGEVKPVDIVVAQPETTLDATAIFSDPETTQDLAYGGGTVSAPQDTLSAVAGSLALTDASGSAVSTYNFSKMKVDSYTWADLIDAETDLTEPVTFNVDGGVSIT